jgi:hypothetical protein
MKQFTRRKIRPPFAAALLACLFVPAALNAPATAQESRGDIRLQHVVDTPFYTMRGPEVPMVALIQTGDEVEYIGDYMGLDVKRATSALRLLRHVDFDEKMLLVVNGGAIEGGMLRVASVYEEKGELVVEVVFADPPPQYGDSGFGSPTSSVYYPSLVTVLPRFQGRLVVHTIPGQWASGGDLRGVYLLVVPAEYETDAGGDDSE